jgi:hypothetical protein
MIGGYTVAYTTEGKIGTGVIVAVRTSLIDGDTGNKGDGKTGEADSKADRTAAAEAQANSDDATENESDGEPVAKGPQPVAFIPFADEGHSRTESNIIRYLTANRRSQLTVPNLAEQVEKQPVNIHSGIYHLYSLRSNQQLARHLLVIYPNGSVHLYRNIRDEQQTGSTPARDYEPTDGMAEWSRKTKHILSITLRLTNSSGEAQTGFMTVRVADTPPRNDITWYTAGFTGLDTEGLYTPIVGLALLHFQQAIIPKPAELDAMQETVNRFIEVADLDKPSVRHFFEQQCYHTVSRPVYDLETLKLAEVS